MENKNVNETKGNAALAYSLIALAGVGIASIGKGIADTVVKIYEARKVAKSVEGIKDCVSIIEKCKKETEEA